MEEKIKIKPLTKSQIIISLDRLTRFKSTEEKYLRVFKDILVSNLINPKFKKKQLELMPYEELTKLVEDVFNYSLECLNINPSADFSINKKLLSYEKSVFKFDKNVEKLMENRIDYQAVLHLIDDKKAPLNLKWIKSLSRKTVQRQSRSELALRFPVEKVIIVEGITEEILLPKFAKLCGCDFDKMGINLISAGGKNQVVKLFYQLSEILRVPIFVLLDNDAMDNYEEIMPKLREHDKVYVLESGEFEDILPLNLIKRTLNKHPMIYSSVILEELRQGERMTEILAELLKQRGLEFKKAEFASMIAENIQNKRDISDEIENVISELN